MDDEPTGDEKSDGKEDGGDGEQVPFSPPQRKEEAYAEDDADDLAGYNIKTGKYENSADERRSQVASW